MGAGLGSCVLATKLSSFFDVTIVDRDESLAPQPAVIDVGVSGGDGRQLAFGQGGTTQLWHNGLIQIPEQIFESSWPFGRQQLDAFYRQAFELLGGGEFLRMLERTHTLADRMHDLGLNSDCFGETLFYPKKRKNSWNLIKHKGNITYIKGRITDMRVRGGGELKLKSLEMVNGGVKQEIYADVFVISAGGLNTPLLLKRHLGKSPKNFEDHPMAFVAEATISKRFYKYWNYSIRPDGFIRIPLVEWVNGFPVSFYIRPGYALWSRDQIVSNLSEIRNAPFQFSKYLGLLRNIDDIFDALSLKLGINMPTRKYAILMVAGCPANMGSTVEEGNGLDQVKRNWVLPDSYLSDIDQAIESFLKTLDAIGVERVEKLKWRESIRSSAHFSATASMGRHSNDGVCDTNQRVFGYENVYVCDGSVIPSSGYSNTGLTIGALAIRLGNFLNRHLS